MVLVWYVVGLNKRIGRVVLDICGLMMMRKLWLDVWEVVLGEYENVYIVCIWIVCGFLFVWNGIKDFLLVFLFILDKLWFI